MFPILFCHWSTINYTEFKSIDQVTDGGFIVAENLSKVFFPLACLYIDFASFFFFSPLKGV